MTSRRRAVVAVAGACALWLFGAGPGLPQDAGFGPRGTPDGPHRAQDWRIPLPHDPQRGMVANVLRPPGEDPRPMAVINHGSPADAAQRAFERPGFAAASEWFVARGYVVVRPIRRGYGATGGAWSETYRSCDEPTYREAGLETAKDIVAAIAFLARQPFVRPDRVVVVGQSAGGWGALALAGLNPPAVSAVVNFAGGRGGYAEGRPHTNCAPDRLIAAAGAYGRTARIPTLWVYTENDGYFGPSLSRAMYRAFSESGGRGEFVLLPGFGSDGHALFGSPAGVKHWEPLVERFLAANAAAN